MKLGDLWVNILTGSTVALMGCVIVAVFGEYDLAWMGAATASAVFLISCYQCLAAMAPARSSPGSPETAEAESV